MLRAEEIAALEAANAHLSRTPGVRYADVRFVETVVERLLIRDGRPEVTTLQTSRGVGVRVLGDRAWGFACTAVVAEGAILEAALRALAIAKASGALMHAPVSFPPRAPSRGTYATKMAIDPFAVSLEDKLAVLDAPVRSILARGRPIRSAEAWMEWTRVHKRLLSTEGTDVDQSMTFGLCGTSCIAVSDDGLAQKRSHPTWQGCDGFQGGFERIREIDLLGNAPRIADEAIALLSAPPCPSGPRDLILESSQLALQIHESCGHPTELDRALGAEISLAGGSFLQPSMLDKFRFGSDLVDVVADSTSDGGFGTFGWDDEGVPAGRHPLVEKGRFVGYLTSRETAARIGREPIGTMRADGWNRVPLIRMVNVSIEPKAGRLEDLIADTKDGVLVATDRSWSIDDLRLGFQFSCEIAWEIKNGKRTRILRDPVYTGQTPAFWRSCDAVCGPEEWKIWGLSTCGKGDPMQIMHVAHGASPARFRRVEIGSA
jgi:TldD protein